VGVLVGLTVAVRVWEGVELGMGTVVGEGVKLGDRVVVVVITAEVGEAVPRPDAFNGCRLQLTATKINIHPRISPTNKFFNIAQIPITTQNKTTNISSWDTVA